MEALEFMKQRDRMCNYYCGEACTHDDSGETCPAESINCDISTDKPEQLVAIVEKWAKEHPEETADATKPKNGEPCVKTIQDDLEGAIYRAIASNKTRIENLEYDVSAIRQSAAKMADTIYALNAKVNYTLKMEPSQTPEPKRTRKDVLLEAFPDAYVSLDGIPDACPLSLDKHYDCNKFQNCLRCKRSHWLAEVEE